MAYIETMKVKVMRMPCAGRDERRAFEWMLSRYTESGSDEDLADIERIAEYNRHAAYWLHRRAVESGEGDDMGYLEKALELGSGDAVLERIREHSGGTVDDMAELEELHGLYRRVLGPRIVERDDVTVLIDPDDSMMDRMLEEAENDSLLNLVLMYDAYLSDDDEEYRDRAARAVADGHGTAQWMLANSLAYDAKVAEDPEECRRLMSEAVGLFERSMDRTWLSARDLGVLLFCARGVDRDIPRAAECFLIAAEHGSGEALRWLDFLTEPPYIDDAEPPTFRWRGISEDHPVPAYFHRSPEWLVLKAVTGERLRSDYPMLSNASGGFENEVFAIFPEDTVVDGSSGVTEWSPCLVFKPTGFRISWDRDPDREADMSQDISWDDLARILRLCIASACDSIREVDA